MRRWNAVVPALIVALGALAQGSQARAQDGDVEKVPVIDSVAMNALQDMGKYLRTLNVFQVKAKITKDEVLENGQNVQFAGTIDLLASRPGKLRVDLNSDREVRTFFYDGSNFTMYAPRLKHYAVVPAPATIIELADRLEKKYDIDLPMVDFFRWGTSEEQTSAITAAKLIGLAVIDGITCEHYAYRQAGLDWQLWMQAGDYPLPRKIVLTTTTDDARPQMVAEYTWNLAPSFNDEAFAFTPAKDVTRIPLAEVTPLAGVTKK